MNEPIIHLHTQPGFEPSPRLRAALERVAEACANEGEPNDSEVEGFASKLSIGDLGSRPAKTRPPNHWNDGCWGFDKDGCNWFQSGEFSCVAASFTT